MITYRDAGLNDVDLLVLLRLNFLEVARSDDCFQKLEANIKDYFTEKLLRDECTVILAEDKSNVIGTGIVFFYDSVPSVSNPRGKNAYITSMYVNERYRRQGIGRTILSKLVETAKAKKCQAVLLSATETGKKLYLKHGFVDVKNNMVFKYGSL